MFVKLKQNEANKFIVENRNLSYNKLYKVYRKIDKICYLNSIPVHILDLEILSNTDFEICNILYD